MKKLVLGISVTTLIVAMSLALPACKKKQEQPAPTAEAGEPTATPTTGQPAGEQTPTAKPPQPRTTPTASGEQKVISAEEYWNIQLERLEVTKKTWTETLAIYNKNEGNPEQTKKYLQEAMQQGQDQMREIFTDHGLNMGADFFPKDDSQRIMQERDQYRREHPDIDRKYKALRDEIREIREQLKKYQGTDMDFRSMRRGAGPDGRERPERGERGPRPMPGSGMRPTPPSPTMPPSPPMPPSPRQGSTAD